MDEVLAKRLADELERHPRITPPDTKMFFEVLANASIPDTSRFYEELPENRQVTEELDLFHQFSLRRVLRNDNASLIRVSGLKKVYETVARAFGIYSSDIMSRKLRENADLVEMMKSADHPFSLLGKFETYDHERPDERYVVTRPVLVIPGADMDKLLEWESANTTYEREVGVIVKHFKKITPQQYFSK